MTRKARKNEFPGANVERVIEVEIPPPGPSCRTGFRRWLSRKGRRRASNGLPK